MVVAPPPHVSACHHKPFSLLVEWWPVVQEETFYLRVVDWLIGQLPDVHFAMIIKGVDFRFDQQSFLNALWAEQSQARRRTLLLLPAEEVTNHHQECVPCGRPRRRSGWNRTFRCSAKFSLS